LPCAPRGFGALQVYGSANDLVKTGKGFVNAAGMYPFTGKFVKSYKNIWRDCG
jgi:hypothetical protein